MTLFYLILGVINIAWYFIGAVDRSPSNLDLGSLAIGLCLLVLVQVRESEARLASR